MAIKYKELGRKEQKWGTDILVEFTDNATGKKFRREFCFKDRSEIDNEFNTRMKNAVKKLAAGRTRELTPDEIVEKMKEHFLTKKTLSKAKAESWFSERVDKGEL
jgi:hypothetical protein